MEVELIKFQSSETLKYTQVKLHKTVARSILSYESEVWTRSDNNRSSAETTDMGFRRSYTLRSEEESSY
jgi:hypothetical protein